MLNPAEFAHLKLGLDPYKWQIAALHSIGQGEKTALCAANESGKTAFVVAASILHFLDTFPRGRCVVTSGSFPQVKDQLWRALETYKGRYPQWTWNECNIKTPEGGFALGFSTNDAGRAEGWHSAGDMSYIPGWNEAHEKDDWAAALKCVAATNDKAAPLFYIIDEAKTVKDGIFEAVERCGPQFRLYTSSPGAPFGQFYRCFTKERQYYRTFRVTSEECPHISAEKREEDIARLGRDHPLVKSMHFAEFAENESELVITAQQLERAMKNQPDPDLAGERVGFCDFAAGGDENTLSMRAGNTVRLVDAWREKDTMSALDRFHGLFRENGLRPGQVWGDAAGLGGPMCDSSKRSGFSIQRFHGGSPPTDAPKKKGKLAKQSNYKDLNAQVWWEACSAIRRGEFCFPDGIDDELFEQICTRPGGFTDKGLLAIIPKSRPRAGQQGDKSETGTTMKSLGLPSPDRADSFLGAIFCGAKMTGAWTNETVKDGSSNRSPWVSQSVRW